MQKITKTFMFGDHEVTLETGRVARQADATVIVTMADTVVMVAAVDVNFYQFLPLPEFLNLTACG